MLGPVLGVAGGPSFDRRRHVCAHNGGVSEQVGGGGGGGGNKTTEAAGGNHRVWRGLSSEVTCERPIIDRTLTASVFGLRIVLSQLTPCPFLASEVQQASSALLVPSVSSLLDTHVSGWWDLRPCF